MAATHYYVSPGSGNDTTGDGTIGTPWATVQKALDTITRNATDGDQINIQAGTADTLAAALTLTTYGSPADGAPLIFRGYTSAANDGGIAEISGGGTVEILNTTARYMYFVDLKLGNCPTGTGQAIKTNGAMVMENCEIHTCYDGVLSADANYMTSLVGCYIRNFYHYGASFNAGFGVVTGCTVIVERSAAIGIRFGLTSGRAKNNLVLVSVTNCNGISSGAAALITENMVYSSVAGTGKGVDNFGETINNVVCGFSGAGGTGVYSRSIYGLVLNNAVYNCTTAYGGASADVLAFITARNNLTLASDPFENAAGGDFRLVASSDAIEAGWPQAYPNYGSVANLPDIGAYQRGAGTGGGGGGPIIGGRIIRGLGAL